MTTATQITIKKSRTCADAGPGRRQAEVELDIFRQKCGVSGQWQDEADTDDETHVERIGQQAPTGTRQVCHTTHTPPRSGFTKLS